MKHTQQKRRYRNALDHIEQGLRACWQNAQDLVKASDKLLEAELHAPALSLAVLALEELAKLAAIEGLLFARPDDAKVDLFNGATKSHAVKLSILEAWPLLLGNLARVDPRYGKDECFHVALAVSIEKLRDDGNAVMAELQGGAFHDLNDWKQKGFYVAFTGTGFVAPSSAVPETMAWKVRQLAWRAMTTLDFLLKGGNLERLIEMARSIRRSFSEEQHLEMEAFGRQLAAERFPHLEERNRSGEAEA